MPIKIRDQFNGAQIVGVQLKRLSRWRSLHFANDRPNPTECVSWLCTLLRISK